MDKPENQQINSIRDDLKILLQKNIPEKFVEFYNSVCTSLKPFDHVDLLLRACRLGLLTAVDTILNRNLVNINCSHKSTGYSALFIAIRFQHHDIIDYLMNHPNIDFQWLCSKKPVNYLDEAIHQWDLLTVKKLLAHNCPIHRRHFFLMIIECFRQNVKSVFPLEIFDELIKNSPNLIDDIGHSQIYEFISNRLCDPTIEQFFSLQRMLKRLVHHDPKIDMIDEFIELSEEKRIMKTGRIHRTQVAIIGSGPAGLMLSCLLAQVGIQSIIIERLSREAIESNIRAGVLEQKTIDLLEEVNAADRLHNDAIMAYDVTFLFDYQKLSIPISDVTEGKSLYVYGQHLVLQDLLEAHSRSNGIIWFNIEEAHIERHDITDDGQRPLIRFRRDNSDEYEFIECDFIGGCDGARSSCCRQSIPNEIITTYEHQYPFCWLSILVDAPPIRPQLIYSFHHEHGFALQSFRSHERARFHLQVGLDDTVDDWPDEKIWSELQKRLISPDSDDKLNYGPILSKVIFGLRNIIHTPMQYKRLFLAGDSAHIVPPTGAKGLNLAIRDASVLFSAIQHYYDYGQLDRLEKYTDLCMEHVLQVHDFADYMTLLMHKLDAAYQEPQNNRIISLLQKARQMRFLKSEEAQRLVANQYCS